MKRSHITREIIELIALALIVFLIVRFVIHGYHVQGQNMTPTIQTDSFVMVNRLSYLFNKPGRGDTIVVHDPFNTNQDTIVRIIALPGDRVRTDSQNIWVNDTQLNEPYVSKKRNSEAKEWVIPANNFFVLNDNRQIEDDSRKWGPLPKDYMVGKAVFVFWPVTSMHTVNEYPSVFSTLPPAR